MSSMVTEDKRTQSKFFPHNSQLAILNCRSRFKLVFAGRRFGKSVLAVNECIDRALAKQSQKIWYCSPLYKQTKEIAWNLFDFYVPKEFILKKNEAELKLILINGSEVSLKGTDNPDSLVGVGLNFAVLDEFPLMNKDVWYKIVRPMMIDTKGECLFIGTPRGFNWAYELYSTTLKDSDFRPFFFKTVDNTSIEGMTEEVLKAKNEAISELDRVTFRQEYEATFEVITGRPRFDVDLLTALRKLTQEKFSSDGLLDIYESPDPKLKYIIGVDTSEGLITGDKSSAVILNAKDYSIAAHYSGLLSPDLFSSYLAGWGKKYNNALIVVESNNHGLVTLNYLKDLYKNIYYKKVFDEISNDWTEKIGFQTNARTKPLLIAELDRALHCGLKIRVSQIINELITYVIEEDGKTNAAEGSHDDSVIALALAIQGYNEIGEKELPPPDAIVNRMTGDYLLQQIKNEKAPASYSADRNYSHVM